jgi:hypothetical protein
MNAKLRGAIVGATLAGMSLLGGAARAGVVTFDDSVGNSLLGQGMGAGQSFSDQGLTFSVIGSGVGYVWDHTAPNSNGTNNNIFGFGPTDTESITKTGGGAFNLNSIDLAISFYDSNPTELITINGTPLLITQTLTTYMLNLNGVSQVNISGVASGTGYWLADNVTFNVAVTPLPSTWTLLIAGFLGLGFVAYRGTKETATAFAAA